MFLRIVLPIVRWLFSLLTHWELVGRENLPLQGPYMLVTNHLSAFDPPLVGAVLGNPNVTVFAAAKYSTGLFGWILRQAGAIFVHRGEVDRAALRQALQVLESGGILGVAPEGTRSLTKTMQRGKTGAAYLALRTGVPLIPVGVIGTDKLVNDLKHLRRGHLRVVIGQPFTLPVPEKRTPEVLQELTDLIMVRIAELLPDEYRGVYSNDIHRSH